MLQIAVNDTYHLHVSVQALQIRFQGAVAANQQVHLHAGFGSFIKLFHHQLVGDVIYFYFDVSFFTGLFVFDFLVDQTNEFLFHFVRRNQ